MYINILIVKLHFFRLIHSHDKSLQAPPHIEPIALSPAQPEVSAEPSGSAETLLPNTPVNPPCSQPQSSTAGVPASDSTAPNQPLSTQTPLLRQRLGDDLIRLVQVRALTKSGGLDSTEMLT